jgi:hypothetical protein
MSITFGSVAPDRLPEVGGLFRQIKGAGNNPIDREASMQWKGYVPHPWFAQSRCRAVEKNGHIAAFGCIAPLRFRSPGQLVESHQIIDWVAGNEVPGGGMLVYRNSISEVGTMVATTASEAARTILARSPWFRPVDPAIYYRRVFRFWNPAHRDRKTPLRMGRDLVLQTRQASLPDSKGWVARRSSLSRVWQREDPCAAIERTVEWFRYLVDCPDARVETGVLEFDGQARGHFLTARQRSRIRVVDLIADTQEQASAFSACLALLQREGASEAQACSSLQSAQQVFETCGMASFRKEPVWIADPKNRFPKELAVESSFLTGDAFYV